jgi:RNA polymerase sigma-70 factor (ECF subfamily)
MNTVDPLLSSENPPLSRTSDDDTSLIAGLLAERPSAWTTFNARYARLIYRAITRITSRFSAVLSADDVQEIYALFCLQLLANDKAKLRSFDPSRGASLASWLGLLAAHATYDFLRSKRREPRLEELTEAEPLCTSVPSPYEVCELRERAHQVGVLLSNFTERDRAFIELYYGEGLEPEQIALRMNISVKTVYSKKHKIRARLEALLERRRLAA